MVDLVDLVDLVDRVGIVPVCMYTVQSTILSRQISTCQPYPN